MNQGFSPKVGIIGAGPCGLTAAKNLLEQGLTNFVVFEKNNQLGGNWVYDECNQHSSVYETTHLISSKFLSEFEDFGMVDGMPDYPSHVQVLKYFQDYAEHFKLHPYLRFNTFVTQAIPKENHSWAVTYQDKTGTHDVMFDYLLVANGHHSDPFMPVYPGHFNGRVLHSHQYKKAAPFKNKRVLVVGGGNSACDVAVEVARVAEKTAISMRAGQHIFPKFILGKATDVAFSKISWLPLSFRQCFAAAMVRILQGRYEKYNLQKPLGRPLDVHPTINSELLYALRHGKLSTYPAIERFEGNLVYFVNGTKDAFDEIIYATGYKTSFSFFNRDLIDYRTVKQIYLYRKMMHPIHENLYFIGLFQPQGCIWPLADYQAKIVAKIISGALNRPRDLAKKIQKEVKTSRRRYQESTRHALEVDYRTFRRQLLRELKKSRVF